MSAASGKRPLRLTEPAAFSHLSVYNSLTHRTLIFPESEIKCRSGHGAIATRSPEPARRACMNFRCDFGFNVLFIPE